MFKFIFYFFGIFAIWWEIFAAQNYEKIEAAKVRFKKSEEGVKLTPSDGVLAFLMIGYFLWNIVGIFSSQWVLFLGLFCLSFCNALFKGRIWGYIDSTISILIILFAIINTYHIHADLLKPIKEFCTYLTS